MIKLSPFFRTVTLVALGCMLWIKSPVSALPLNLNLVGPVQQSGTDTQSNQFNTTTLPTVSNFITTNTKPNGKFAPAGISQANPANIFWAEDRKLRVYFISEDAGYKNSLGFSQGNDFTLTPGEHSLIFPNASSPNPLTVGDFVDLGILSANTKLNFYLLANGFVSAHPNIIWTTSAANNPADSLQHYYAVNQFGANHLLYSVEDLPLLGDADFNDLHFVVEALPTPEPQTYILLGLFLTGVAYLRKSEKTSTASLAVSAND